MKIDIQRFKKLVDEKYISVQEHPFANLLIWNYTPKTQFNRFWTNETMTARGLITDTDGNIKARPFRKFFNLAEHIGQDSLLPPLPKENFEVFDKLDGSLGIMYFINGKPQIATRGSFVSDQAKWATEILHKKYFRLPFNEFGTYLFEIIHPQNRIVVDYKDKKDLILLSALVTDTGKEMEHNYLEAFGKQWNIPVVKKFHGINDIMEVSKIHRNNAEGFVIRFESGYRVKVKYDEYVRLHRLITGVNARTIWDLLRYNQPFDELLNNVPDEYYEWVRNTRDDLKLRFKEIKYHTEEIFKLEFKDNLTRKELAERFMQYPDLSNILFGILDNKEIDDRIWRKLKPEASKPFREDIDI